MVILKAPVFCFLLGLPFHSTFDQLSYGNPGIPYESSSKYPNLITAGSKLSDDQKTEGFPVDIEESDATSIKLHWEPIEGVYAYEVYRDNMYAGFTVSKTGYFTDFGLNPNQTYSYVVTAIDANGVWVYRSNIIYASTKNYSHIRTHYKVLALAFYPEGINSNEFTGIKTYFRHRLEFFKLASIGSAIIEPFSNDIITIRAYPPTLSQGDCHINYSEFVKTPYEELDGFSIIDLIEKGEIDFVWITKTPDDHCFDENKLIGNKNIGSEYSGWISLKVGCSRSFFVNGYLPDERCNDAYAHMVEGIMTTISNSYPGTWPRDNEYLVYTQTRTDFTTKVTRNLNLFERFRLTDQWNGRWGEQYASDGNGNCGTSHFPPNSRRNIDLPGEGRYDGDYAYYDPKTWSRYIDCYADDWFNFPYFRNAKRKINGYDFGAFNYYQINVPSYSKELASSPEKHTSFKWAAASYHQWWFNHLPRNSGVWQGRLNNWWPYIYDYNRFNGSSITYIVDSFPSVPVLYPFDSLTGIDDSISDHWGYWHTANGFSQYGKNGILSTVHKKDSPGNVKSGNTSIKVIIENTELYEYNDVGSNDIFFPKARNARWYFRFLDSIYFSVKLDKNPHLIIDANPVFKLCANEGNRIELVPLKDGSYANMFQEADLKDENGWYNFSIPLCGNNRWEKNIIGYIDPGLDSAGKAIARAELEKKILSCVNYIKICIRSTRLKSPIDTCSFLIDNINFYTPQSDSIIPSPAGVISGDTSLCVSLDNVLTLPATYMVPVIKGATHYLWTLPSGDTLVNDTSITIQFNKSIKTGVIKVKGCNQFGCGSESNNLKFMVTDPPAAAGLISGETDVCNEPSIEYNYTVAEIEGATSYVWGVPSMSSGSSETNSITLVFNQFAGGPYVHFGISVQGANHCGLGEPASLQIMSPHGPPIRTGTVTGSSKVCKDTTAILYKVEGIEKAASYIWILPSGATGLSTSDTISVKYGDNAESGDIVVKGLNVCGEGEETVFPVEVIDVPAPEISLLSGVLYSSAAAGNQWYLNNILIPEANLASYTPLENGEYTVISSVEGCLSSPSQAYHYNFTSLPETDIRNKISVYPNSTSGLVVVSVLESFETNYSVDVYNLFSRIKSYDRLKPETVTTIDLSLFPAGIYFVQVRLEGKAYLYKIIKH